MANTVRSGSPQVDVVWRPAGLSPVAWPDLMAGPLTSKPLVMLVNSNTASASEVLAGEGALSLSQCLARLDYTGSWPVLATAIAVLAILDSSMVCSTSVLVVMWHHYQRLNKGCRLPLFVLHTCKLDSNVDSSIVQQALQQERHLTTCLAAAACAGALHDDGRAVIMGERTFGKGVVQYFFPMGDGSGLKLTVAKYLTPKLYDISKNGGLSPDIYCKDYPHGETSTACWHAPCSSCKPC